MYFLTNSLSLRTEHSVILEFYLENFISEFLVWLGQDVAKTNCPMRHVVLSPYNLFPQSDCYLGTAVSPLRNP